MVAVLAKRGRKGGRTGRRGSGVGMLAVLAKRSTKGGRAGRGRLASIRACRKSGGSSTVRINGVRLIVDRATIPRPFSINYYHFLSIVSHSRNGGIPSVCSNTPGALLNINTSAPDVLQIVRRPVRPITRGKERSDGLTLSN